MAAAALELAIKSGHPEEAPRAAYMLGGVRLRQGQSEINAGQAEKGLSEWRHAMAAFQKAVESEHPVWAPQAAARIEDPWSLGLHPFPF